ncbi:MAG: extracellular solute-binding protein [Caldilineaceae bacterium]
MHTSSAQEPEQSPELSSLPVNGRMSRRMFLQAGLAVTAGGALLSAVSFAVSGCALRADEFLPAAERRAAVTTIPSREDIQLVYQDWRTDWFPALVEDMLAEFHDQHPDIRVFFTPDPDNLAESMLADMQAGTAPDLFWGGSTFFPTWAQRGYLLDLRPFVAEDLDERTIAEWDPAQYRAFFLPDGMQYGLPKHHGVVALYYNKDLFDRQGVPYPSDTWTYTDYLDAMQQLTDIGGVRDRDLWGSMIDVSWGAPADPYQRLGWSSRGAL